MGLLVSRAVENGVQKIQAGLANAPAAQGPSHHSRPAANNFYKWGVTFEDPALIEAVKNAAEGGMTKRAAKQAAAAAKAGAMPKSPAEASLSVKKKATKASTLKSPARRAPASAGEAAQAQAAVEELVVQGRALPLPASKATPKRTPEISHTRKRMAPAKKVGTKKGARRVASKGTRGGRSAAARK